MQAVIIVGLGPVSRRVNLTRVVSRLNRAQREYTFDLDDPLLNLPPPTMANPTGNYLPQYDAKELFGYLDRHRASPQADSIVFGVIDSKVFDDLYSTIDCDNRYGVVSVRTSSLTDVLAESRKTIEQYVELEISAQLLAIQYRRRATIHADPSQCAAPWHIDRRDCLFDYYGLSKGNVQKLIAPRLSERVIADLRDLEVPQRQIDASLAIVGRSSRTKWVEIVKRAPSDPTTALAGGGVIGLSASVIPSQPGLWGLFAAGSLAVIARLAIMKRK
jgi:hypothetical protein